MFGVLAGLQGGRMAANLPTPLMGIEERLNIFAYMLWVVVLALGMLRARRVSRASAAEEAPARQWTQQIPQRSPAGVGVKGSGD